MKGKLPLAVLFSLILIIIPLSAGEWSEISRLTYSGSADDHVILIDPDDNMHVIFEESVGGRAILKYMKLDENGERLIPSKTAISGNGESRYPSVAMDDDGIHLVWWDSRTGNYRLFYTLLNHNGSRIMSERPLNVELSGDKAPSEAPRVDLDEFGNLFMVWSHEDRDPSEPEEQEELGASVFYMKIDHEGNVIIPQFRISSGYANGIYPDVELDPMTRSHIVWSEDITGNYEVYYTIIDDRSLSEDPDLDIIRLTESPMESIMSRLLYHGNQLYISWSDGDSSGDIYSLHFGRIGSSGLTLDTIVSKGGNAFYPSLASHDSQVYISWQDDRHSMTGAEGRDAYDGMKDNITSLYAYVRRHTTGEQGLETEGELTNWEVYFTVIDSYGTVVQGNTRITSMNRASIHPQVAVNGRGNARIVWIDTSQSSGDIYFIGETHEEMEKSETVINAAEGSLVMLGGVGILLLVYLLSGEGRRYAILKFCIVPLYSTLTRDKLMENDNRRQIIDLINAREGITFTTLMDELGLKNGALAYHLYTLERRRYIKSVKDGKFRRFYPRGAQVSGLSSLEEKIISVIKDHPSISQREIADIIDSTPQTVNYNIKKLIERGVVYLRKDGKHTRCNLTNPSF